VQTFYGIRDNGSPLGGTRVNLQQQSIQLQTTYSSLAVRTVTNNTVNYATQDGWYLDLLDPPAPGTATGERVISTAMILDNRAIFVTVIPSERSAHGFGHKRTILNDMFKCPKPRGLMPRFSLWGNRIGWTYFSFILSRESSS